jgi:pimeloyl-ACP methyl ester carboxylesterase
MITLLDVIFPLVGISLAVVLLLDFVLLQRMPALRQALNEYSDEGGEHLMQSQSDQAAHEYRTLKELTPDHWQSDVIHTSDGATIHYTRTGGKKPALLLLHGVQSIGLTWLRTAQALESDYDVVMPDFRGHGASSRIAAGFTVDRLVDDMIELTRTLDLGQPFVAGHSLGADIAGRLAAVFPLRALVLVDPALHNYAAGMALDPDAPPPWMAAMFETMRALRTQSHAERMVNGRKLLPPGTPTWAEADYVSFVEAQAQFDLAMYRSTASMGYLFEAPTLIAQISCPVLLLVARPMLPGIDVDAGLAAFEQNLRAYQHMHFADSGHFIPFDQFERFVEVVSDFLRRH